MKNNLATKTLLVDDANANSVVEAVSILKNGGIFISTSDTGYRFFLDSKKETYDQFFRITRKKLDEEAIYFVGSIEILRKNILLFDDKMFDFLISVWPNPISIKFNLSKEGKKNLNKESAFFRIPNNNFCLKFLSAYDSPVLTSDAVRKNEPIHNDFTFLNEEFNSEVEAIFYTKKKIFDKFPTTIDLTTDRPILVNEGKYKFSTIEKKFIECYG